jgi:DNA adenine methylase
MKYMGSKARFTKEILPIILKDRKSGQWYVEPFAGGMNTICEVQGNRIANDKNYHLIEMWRWIIKKGIPLKYNEINKDLYDYARDIYNKRIENTLSDAIIGWIGWMGSANGRFFDGGYSGKSNTKIGTVRDYIKEAINNIEKQLPKMIGVQFENKDYTELEIPNESIIYCDIPYQGTKQYSTSKDFNHSNFLNWCREKANQGHTIFVSEYNAPADFECVWEKEAKSSLSANGKIGGNKISVEKLFKFSSTNFQ